MPTLRMQSRDRIFGLTEGSDQAFSSSIGAWRVFEVYEPDVHKKVREGLGAYRVVLETEVTTQEEARSRNREGIRLCEEFEVAWLYTWASPLHRFGWTRVVQVVRPPEGWSTNYRDIERGFSPIHAVMNINMQHWIYMSFLPLERGLRIREKIASADDILRTLIDIHYAAHTVRGMPGAIFSLCKGLEIAREILPGRGDIKKEKNFPADARGALRQPLHTLFGMANNYLETRHAIRKKGTPPILHPRLGGEELLSFLQDLDLVLGTVVCMSFGEEPVVLRRDAPKRP